MIKLEEFLLNDFYKVEIKKSCVLLILSMDNNLVMELTSNFKKFYINFLMKEIEIGIQHKEVVLDFLKERNIFYNEIRYLGNIFPEDGVLDEVHIYHCSLNEQSIILNTVILSEWDVSNYIDKKMIFDDITKKAFYRYLNVKNID